MSWVLSTRLWRRRAIRMTVQHLHATGAFFDALAVVQKRRAGETVPVGVRLGTAARAQGMAVLQPAELAVALRPAPIVRATGVAAPVAPPVLVDAAYDVRVVRHPVGDLTPVDRGRIAQF